MRRLPLQRQTLILLAVLVPLVLLFVYVTLRSGPLAPVPVTLATVGDTSIAPGVFGIGVVESRYTYKIGPTVPGRLQRLSVDVGDRVRAGQVMGTMDPVDLDDRARAQDATLRRVEAALRDSESRQRFAQTQARRYEQLLIARSTSEEIVAARQQDLQLAEGALSAARDELARVNADREALRAQRANLQLVAPVDGLVAARNADPGTTVVAGQSVVELIDPTTLWINVRFDQGSAHGLRAGQPARILLRSRAGQLLNGRVLRVEPKADAVTEETLARVVLDVAPDPLPPVGELAEVTVALAALPRSTVIPNAAVQRVDGKTGVWQVVDGSPQFTAVTLGATDLEGRVQVLSGLRAGDRVVVYSAKVLTSRSRITESNTMPGVPR
ncbi:MAG: efflux RND transporter periplasmic adaptor subunit [Gemmatimonadaceae bacterium]|nr:efflux RND transporter periplasmic adaptor subunit [Gemmatimonadaceae bacterium]